MKTFAQYHKEQTGEDISQMGTINGEWFAEHGYPMIVECCGCGSTMVLPSAYVSEPDENGDCYVYCASCAGED